MYGVCSHVPSANGMIDRPRLMCALDNGNGLQVNFPDKWGVSSLAEWKAYLAAQYAAGTPVQVAYKLETPIKIPFDPAEIIALSGTNTMYGDGITYIHGRQSKINALENRIAALESVILNL